MRLNSVILIHGVTPFILAKVIYKSSIYLDQDKM
jgi:hypothetical protein